MAPAKEPTFPKDEKVLCFHHELLYEAKVLDSKPSNPSDKKSPLLYRVHYKGWKNTWDDWVPADRLKKYNDENLQLARNMKKESEDVRRSNQPKSVKKRTAETDLSSTRDSEDRQTSGAAGGRGQKRMARDYEIERSQMGKPSAPAELEDSLSELFKPRNKKRGVPDHENEAASGSLTSPTGTSSGRPGSKNARQKGLRARRVARGSSEESMGTDGRETVDRSRSMSNVSEEAPASPRSKPRSQVPGPRKHRRSTLRNRKHTAEQRLESCLPHNLWQILNAAFVENGPIKEFSFFQRDGRSVLIWDRLDSQKQPIAGSRAGPSQSLDMPTHGESTASRSMKEQAGPAPSQPQRDTHQHSHDRMSINSLLNQHSHVSRMTPPNEETYNTYDSEPLYGEKDSGSLSGDLRSAPPAIGHPKAQQRSAQQEIDTSKVSSSHDVQQEQSEASIRDINLPPGCRQTEEASGFHGQSTFLYPSRRKASEDLAFERKIACEENFLNRPAVRLPLPDHLKSILVDDWEFVTKGMSIVPLPSPHPVNEILDTYFNEEKSKRRLGSPEADLLEEVVMGMKDYFDLCLGRTLLYRFERQQYFEVKKGLTKGDYEGRKAVGDIYGAEHLTRLFVSLPELISQTNMDAQSVKKLKEEVQILTQWLSKNSSRFFVQNYQLPGAEYIEAARGL